MRPGEPAFFTLLVSNNLKRSEVYNISFEDPDENILSEPEISLVHNYNNNSEWEYWYKNGKCPEPQKWDTVDDAGNVYLEPNEQ